MTLDSEQRRALEMLAGNPRGITEAVLTTNGLAGDLLAGLVRDGMATVASETLWAEGRPSEVVRVKITEAGQQALQGTYCAAHRNSRHATARALTLAEAGIDKNLADRARKLAWNPGSLLGNGGWRGRGHARDHAGITARTSTIAQQWIEPRPLPENEGAKDSRNNN